MNEWIKWAGGACPVPIGTAVEVRFRDGTRVVSTAQAVRARWEWGPVSSDADIVAYRVVQPAAGPTHDPVNHPPHYTAGGIECIDAIQAALTPEEFRGYCKGNALKYVWRERHKGGAESLAKAQWYLKRMEGGK